ncbi:hypothetical protein MBANPS3_004171 [Mucor bainieri]
MTPVNGNTHNAPIKQTKTHIWVVDEQKQPPQHGQEKYIKVSEDRLVVYLEDMRRNTNLWIQLFKVNSRTSGQKLQESKSQDQKSQLYILNKKLHNQRLIAAKPAPAPHYFDAKTKIQGVDPKVVTMANGVCTCQKLLFESINRYQVLQGHQETVHHGMDDDVPFKMTSNMVNAEVDTKTSPSDSPKKEQKKRVKSNCRLRRFYAKHCSQHRRQMGSKSFITFTGNWHGASTYIKGHNRR